MLIIDETQNIKKRGAEQIMNFFVHLINSGINLCLIGTPGAYDLFGKELRMTRRLTGNAEIIYNNMEYGDEFIYMLESLWKYQWTEKVIPYHDEFADVFYEETQGISDLVVKLFVYTQQIAIEGGKEEISIGLLRKVAKERFRLLKPMLDAIRSGNPHRIAKYEDIRRIGTEYSPMERAKNELKREVQVINKRSNTTSTTNTVENTKKTSKKVKRQEYMPDDLRYLMQQGHKQEKTPYQVLLENGFVEDTLVWIEGERV
ncbi:ATP-binding protein [Bacillus sp. JRC01]|nr:ATP-binding protein [Bacillus sp. JRC01]